MSADKNIQLQRKFWDAINRGDLDELDEYLSPNLVEHEPLPSGYPQGREGVKEFFRMFRKAFPDARAEIQQIVSDGDLVAEYYTITGTHRGEFMGVPPTGRRVKMEGMDIQRISKNKLVEHWGLFDRLGTMEQLGAVPATSTRAR